MSITLAEKQKIFIVSEKGNSKVAEALNDFFEICLIDLNNAVLLLEKEIVPQIILLTTHDIDQISAFLNTRDQHDLNHISFLWYPEQEVIKDSELLWCYEHGVNYVSGKCELGLHLLVAKVQGEIRSNRLISEYHQRRLLFGKARSVVKNEDIKFMNAIYEYLSTHLLTKDFCIQKLGADLGMSRTHFFIKVKAITGGSPSKLVMNYRLGKAASLLEKRAGNISDIAYGVGFSSTAYFSKCFKEQFGKQPSAYLNEIKSVDSY